MKRAKSERIRQPVSEDLRDSILTLLKNKFYRSETGQVDERAFAQDRSRLLAWVVLWPAQWLNEKGVTIHGEAYRQLFVKVFLQAAANVQSKIKYRPAYLKQVIQSHIAVHGEEYYDEAKSVRSLAEQALMIAGQVRQQQPDPVAELAKAAKLLSTPKARRKPVLKPAGGPVNMELNLG